MNKKNPLPHIAAGDFLYTFVVKEQICPYL
jgi:hypothetical protein